MNGSEAALYTTMQAAMDAASPGDHILPIRNELEESQVIDMHEGRKPMPSINRSGLRGGIKRKPYPPNPNRGF